jgi:hypothetical protein
MNRRPVSVAIIGCLFLAAGAVGLAYHATEIRAERLFENDAVWVCLVRLLAMVGGAFLLRGRDWARWLLAAWMAYHIVLSAFHSLEQLLAHCLLFGVIAWFLFRPRTSAFFRRGRVESAQAPENDDPRLS